MKLQRRDAKIVFIAKFDYLDEITAYTTTSSGNIIVGCGKLSTTSAGYFKMRTNGNFNTFINIGATNTLCQGISYDET